VRGHRAKEDAEKDTLLWADFLLKMKTPSLAERGLVNRP
jgi:hypothetical protein